MFLGDRIDRIFRLNSSRNPTPDITAEIPVKWKPVRTPNAMEYLHIGQSKIDMKQDFLPARMRFWDGLSVRTDLETEMKQKVKDEL